jgi:CheY-like chemotaxis protein
VADARRAALVDLRGPLTSAIAVGEKEIRERARLVTDFDAVPQVLADEQRLAQLFLYLLVNAWLEIDEREVDRHEIAVKTSTDAEGRAVIAIRDTGEGIAPEALPRLFEPLFAANEQRTGTRLLAECREIVTELGGTIEVESAVGRGTTFRVTLPAADVAAEALPPPPARVPGGGKRGRVLVIDDDPVIGRVAMVLLGRDHEVSYESRAIAALDRLRGGERFDVILCDLAMPEMNGVELYTQVAGLDHPQADAMVFLTGGAFTRRAREFVDAASNEVFHKPFDPKELVKLVRRRVG